MAEGIEKTRKRDNFTSGVATLSLSVIIVKIIGLIYKIPMLGLLGSEGMGYFNSAYEIYVLFCSVATTGLPVAMSVMIASEKSGSAHGIFRSAFKLFLMLGALGAIVVFAFAKPFSVFLGSENAALSILSISPCVMLISLCGAYRGYFQGKGKMLPTAVSQIIEALGKLILGLIFAFIALRLGWGTPSVAAMAVLGLTLGTGVAAFTLMIYKRLEGRNSEFIEPTLGVCGKLLRFAIPVTLSSSVVSLTKVIDMSMILRRLRDIGFDSTEAFAAYGNYTTLALPLFSLAPALVTSVALPLIPALGQAIRDGDGEGQKRVAENAIRLTALIAMPAGVGIALFAKPVLALIFSGQTAAVESTYPLLSLLGLSVAASCMITVENALLQAYMKPWIPIISTAVGSAFKIILAFILIGNRNFGLLGAPISTLFCDLVINAINFCFIEKEMPKRPRVISLLLRPFFAAVIAVSLSRVAYNWMVTRLGEGRGQTLIAVALAAVLYLIASIIFGTVEKNEISSIFRRKKFECQ